MSKHGDIDLSNPTDARFMEDVFSLVDAKPVLFNDVIAALRGGNRTSLDLASGRRWRNVREQDVERALRDLGAHFGAAKHGAGIAVYVASVAFSSAVNGRGKVVAVTSYGPGSYL